MYIAIVGYGRMGRLVEETAKQRRVSVVSTIDPKGGARYASISEESIGQAEVCVCFTQASTVIDTIAEIASFRKNIVMATTGWDEHLDSARELVDKAGIGMVFSPNFALGVNIFFRMVEACASIIDGWEDYDAAVHEIHHRGKADSPSGTALVLGQALVDRIRGKSACEAETLDGKIADAMVHITSTRCGHEPGYHSVIFDSEVDTIELSHRARSRKSFAVGALTAAEWIIGRTGCYTKDDVVADLFSRSK